MNKSKTVCCIYRTHDHTEAGQNDLLHQRDLCRRFIEQQGWPLLREFHQVTMTGDTDELLEDALDELKAGAEQHGYDVLLVSEFSRIGRIPMECSLAAGFFERNNVEVWSVKEGHIGIQTAR